MPRLRCIRNDVRLCRENEGGFCIHRSRAVDVYLANHFKKLLTSGCKEASVSKTRPLSFLSIPGKMHRTFRKAAKKAKISSSLLSEKISRRQYYTLAFLGGYVTIKPS